MGGATKPLDGKQCCNSYVAPGYSTPDDFRIAVVGMEHGSKGHSQTHESRRELILRAYCIADREKNSFNGHYKGVVQDCRRDPWRVGKGLCRRLHDDLPAAQKLCHQSHRTAQSCALHANNTGEPRCARFAGDEAQLLTPPLRRTRKFYACSWPSFRGAGEARGGLLQIHWKKWDASRLDGIAEGRRPYILYHVQELAMHVLFTYHGGRNQLARQWPEVRTWIAYVLCTRASFRPDLGSSSKWLPGAVEQPASIGTCWPHLVRPSRMNCNRSGRLLDGLGGQHRMYAAQEAVIVALRGIDRPIWVTVLNAA